VVRNIAGDSPDVRKCDLSSCYSCLGYALLPMVAFSLLSILLPKCAPLSHRWHNVPRGGNHLL
jgi:hypothetical protein